LADGGADYSYSTKQARNAGRSFWMGFGEIGMMNEDIGERWKEFDDDNHADDEQGKMGAMKNATGSVL
jgi:hypothetical protein